MGRAELRSLLRDPHAPSPAQAAQLGSRAALSPMRARPFLRGSLGHAQVRSPPDPAHRHTGQPEFS